MNEPRKTSGKSSPWREPIMWLVFGLVGLSILGSVMLLRLALRDGPMDAVPDDVRRTGRAQESDLGPDESAALRGLAAILRIDATGGRLIVTPVAGAFDPDRPLQLELHHPVQAAEDRQLQLAPAAGEWQVQATLPSDHDWLVRLQPADGAWRLRGRLPRAQSAVHLAPAVSVDARSATH